MLGNLPDPSSGLATSPQANFLSPIPENQLTDQGIFDTIGIARFSRV